MCLWCACVSIAPSRPLALSLPPLLAHSCFISKHVVHTAHICVCMTMHFRVAWWTIDRYIYRCYYCCTYVCYCCVAVVAIQVLIRTCMNLPLHRLHTHTCRSESVHQTVHQFTLFEYGVCVFRIAEHIVNVGWRPRRLRLPPWPSDQSNAKETSRIHSIDYYFEQYLIACFENTFDMMHTFKCVDL